MLVQPCTSNFQYNIVPATAGTALLVQNCQLLILDYTNNHLSLLGNIWPKFFFIGLAWHAFSAVADLHVRNIDWQKGAPKFFQPKIDQKDRLVNQKTDTVRQMTDKRILPWELMGHNSSQLNQESHKLETAILYGALAAQQNLYPILFSTI